MRYILTIIFSLVICELQAQTEVTAGVMMGKKYGVTYMLPKTVLVVTTTTTRHSYVPGQFCRYAERYLRLTDVSPEPEEHYTLDKVEVTSVGVPDNEAVYFVEMKDRTTAPLMQLTPQGVVVSINMPYSPLPEKVEPTPKESPEPLDPRAYLTEEMLMASSTAKMAELVAKEIYSIRDSKSSLIRGEADNMPKDGQQLEIMLANLNRQEAALTQMFTGTHTEVQQIYTERVVPNERTASPTARFSTKSGYVSADNLSGEPIYMQLMDQRVDNHPAAVETPKKGLTGVAYNVPGLVDVTITYKHAQFFRAQLPATQYGTREYLAPQLFNKNALTKVLFDPDTGALLKIER